MILTVCMSPSVDVTVELDALNIGRVNLVKSKTLTFTGKAINVAIGVSRLGEKACVTGFMYNENGDAFEHALVQEGIESSFIWNEGRVRENYKIIDNKTMLTEINDFGGQVREENLEKLIEVVKERSALANVTVVTGGLPRGVDVNYYRDISRAVHPNSLRIVDTQGAKLFAALETGVDLVKPNREELEHSLGRSLRCKGDVLAACRELLDRGARSVLLSLGSDGAVITNGTKNYFCKSINVAVNSTVGAGDGMVAAAAVKMQEGADLADVLRAGVAAGTATVTTFGTVSFTKKKYDEIWRGLTVSEF